MCCHFLGFLLKATGFLFKVILMFPIMSSPGDQSPVQGVLLCSRHSGRVLCDLEEGHGLRGGWGCCSPSPDGVELPRVCSEGSLSEPGDDGRECDSCTSNGCSHGQGSQVGSSSSSDVLQRLVCGWGKGWGKEWEWWEGRVLYPASSGNSVTSFSDQPHFFPLVTYFCPPAAY